MSKLTKAQAKHHAHASGLLAKNELTEDEKDYIQEHWQESANHVNSSAGAFFTPPRLARDLAIEVGTCGRVIDLCAGIGTLASAIWHQQAWERASGFSAVEIVCVELNPDYVAVGRKMLPEATWICASVFDLPDLGRFDAAVSNPPFGGVKRGGRNAPRYRGNDFEYHVIDIASDLAAYGAFIIPQTTAGFRYSGADFFEDGQEQKYLRFKKQTGLELRPGCGVDTSIYADEWHGVSPLVEIVTADFSDLDRGFIFGSVSEEAG